MTDLELQCITTVILFFHHFSWHASKEVLSWEDIVLSTLQKTTGIVTTTRQQQQQQQNQHHSDLHLIVPPILIGLLLIGTVLFFLVGHFTRNILTSFVVNNNNGQETFAWTLISCVLLLESVVPIIVFGMGVYFCVVVGGWLWIGGLLGCFVGMWTVVYFLATSEQSNGFQ